MSKNILSYFISIIIITIFAAPLFASAVIEGCNEGSGEGCNTGMPIKILNPFKADTIQELIKSIVNDILMPIGGVVAVMMIMYAGYLFVTARGNETQITKAKQALLWAVIGAAILLGAWVISTAISATINQLKAP
jgi:hypothetical protein